jgi:ATP-binding cassette subfamily B protein
VKTETKETIKIFWNHTKRYPWSFSFIVVGIFLASFADTIQPFFAKILFDGLGSNDPSQYSTIVHAVVYISLLIIANFAGWRMVTFLIAPHEIKVKKDLYRTCYDYLHNHSYSFFSNQFVGSLVRKLNRFDRAYESIIDTMAFNLVKIVLRVFAMVGILFWFRPMFGWIFLTWTLLFIAIQYIFVRYKMNIDLQVSTADSAMTGHLADTITNNVTIKSFSALKREKKGMEELLGTQYNLVARSWRLSNIAETVQATLMVGLNIVLMAWAVHLWRLGQFSVGDYAFIQTYTIQLFSMLWDIGRHMKKLYEEFAYANEMTEILLQPHTVSDVENAQDLRVRNGNIVFDNVSFSYYPGKYVLKNFSLNIAPGERVAFVGSSGGGKTTITKLLLRFYDIERGSIAIDGQNIRGVTQDSLRNSVAFVPQDPVLFHRTLMDNIKYGKPKATKEEVIRASKMAHCHEFINSLPDGYDTFVGERGVKLSGGERQRVAIARAILKNAPILVLDEATSSLDSESEKLIQDALQNLMKGRTTIVIAHRLSTIMQMDRIVVIQKGKIIEQGKHEELLKAQQGIYQKLWDIQAGGFA